MKSKYGLQVLVVEDEPLIRMLIEDMLIEIGSKDIEAAASIDTALKFLGDIRPDFAILDIDLNGTRSYPVAALLRSRTIPFVFVSGYDATILDTAYADVRILQKPFRISDLESAIETTLAVGSAVITRDRGVIE